MGRKSNLKKFIAPCLGCALFFVAFTRMGMSGYAALAAPYPESWLILRPGMTTSEIRGIIGPPTADGRGLKGMDVWEVHRLGVRLRLEIFHGGDTDGTSMVHRMTRSKQLILPGAQRFDECSIGDSRQ
ncbi:MAG: hypothetical protein JWL81_3316 [Verrucomicrobiales bacterium]|nr:hypothetical protein [Verrucomicrobiales bacterium]